MKLALLAVLAFAAPFSPDPDAANLRLSGSSALAAVNGLLSTPVEPRHAGTLKGYLDQVLASAGSSAGGIEVLGQRMAGEASKMKAGAKAVEPKLAAAKERGEKLQPRLDAWKKDVTALIAELEKKAEVIKDDAPKKEAAKKKTDLARFLLARAHEAGGPARQAVELKALEDAHWDMRSIAGYAAADADSLPDLRPRLEGLTAAVDQGKIALNSLDVEPKNEHRTRAYESMSRVQDAGRAVSQDCETARSRASALADRHKSWLKAESDFESKLKFSAKQAEQAEAALSELETAASELRRS